MDELEFGTARSGQARRAKTAFIAVQSELRVLQHGGGKNLKCGARSMSLELESGKAAFLDENAA